MPRHYLAPTGSVIIGATTHFAPDDLTITPDGTPAFVDTANLLWVYFDANGDEWTFAQLTPETVHEEPPGGGSAEDARLVQEHVTHIMRQAAK